MGVLSLHNECPPMNYDLAEVKEVSRGLVIGEQATAATLRALADCLQALACMDDTVGSIVSAWGEITTESGEIDPERAAAKSAEVRTHYASSFETLSETTGRISIAVQKYRDHQDYGRSALTAGRGQAYQQYYAARGEESFASMIGKRIELLRKLKVRVKVLRHLEALGIHLLEQNDYSEFFLVLMQPIRDVTIATRDLYTEVVRGALVSHSAMFQGCQLPGEELTDQQLEEFLSPVLVGAKNDDGHE